MFKKNYSLQWMIQSYCHLLSSWFNRTVICFFLVLTVRSLSTSSADWLSKKISCGRCGSKFNPLLNTWPLLEQELASAKSKLLHLQNSKHCRIFLFSFTTTCAEGIRRISHKGSILTHQAQVTLGAGDGRRPVSWCSLHWLLGMAEGAVFSDRAIGDKRTLS